jgi:hypothetical protein
VQTRPSVKMHFHLFINLTGLIVTLSQAASYFITFLTVISLFLKRHVEKFPTFFHPAIPPPGPCFITCSFANLAPTALLAGIKVFELYTISSRHFYAVAKIMHYLKSSPPADSFVKNQIFLN